MRKSTYRSCNCKACRNWASGWRACKEWFKQKSHRKYRRLEREAVRQGKEVPDSISTGFRA